MAGKKRRKRQVRVTIPPLYAELHEAAHAVVAAVLLGPDAIDRVEMAATREPQVMLEGELGLGEDTGALWLVDDPELIGASVAQTPAGELPEAVLERARARALINLAGVYGGQLATGDWRIRLLKPSGSDLSNAWATANMLTSYDMKAAERLILGTLNPEAERLVRQYAAAIRTVALALDDRRRLSGADVGAILSSLIGPA